MKVILCLILFVCLSLISVVFPLYYQYNTIRYEFIWFLYPYALPLCYAALMLFFTKNYKERRATRVGLKISYIFIFVSMLLWAWYYGDFVKNNKEHDLNFYETVNWRDAKDDKIYINHLYMERVISHLDEEWTIRFAKISGKEGRFRISSQGMVKETKDNVAPILRYSDILKKKDSLIFEDLRTQFVAIIHAYYEDVSFQIVYKSLISKIFLFITIALLFSSGIVLVGIVESRLSGVLMILVWDTVVSIVLLWGLPHKFIFMLGVFSANVILVLYKKRQLQTYIRKRREMI